MPRSRMTTGVKVALGCAILLAAGVGLCVVFVGVLYFGRATEQARTRTEAPADTVTAAELCADYESNEVSADDRYRRQVLHVSGMIATIEAGPTGAYAMLACPRGSVQAHFQERGAVGGLHKGERAELICIGSGELLGMVQLRECRRP